MDPNISVASKDAFLIFVFPFKETRRETRTIT